VIFIGTPVWAFTYVPAFSTFFDKAVLENKKIALFCTHEGGPSNTISNMKAKLPNNEFIGESDYFKPSTNTEASIEKAAS
jgi:UDP-N-acetyl-D-mannosaminuronic acid transferase (WecB/TagA/CpsF family)